MSYFAVYLLPSPGCNESVEDGDGTFAGVQNLSCLKSYNIGNMYLEQINAEDLAHHGWIGCAGWLVTQ